MKKIVLALIALLCGSVPLLADVPHTFTLDAQVFDAEAADGFSYQGDIRIDLYDAAEDGSSLWNETHRNASIDNGYLSLELGTVNTVTPLSGVLIEHAGEALFVQVALGGLGYTFPARLSVTSVPYALVCSEAGNAQTFQNMEPDAFSLDGHTHVKGDITDFAHSHDERYYTKDMSDGRYATIGHNHDTAYLAIDGMATDADKLDGNDSAYFCTDTECGDLATQVAAKADAAGVYTKTEADATFLGLHAKADSAVTAENVDGQPLLKAMKLALGFSDTPGQANYLSDQAFTDYMQNLCPLGYTRSMEGDDADYIVCKRGLDEMVKVGDFWIDRYEAILVDEAKWNNGNCDCEGTIYGQNSSVPDWNTIGFANNGSDSTISLYACSVKNVGPTRNITWFQAQTACGEAGKELCADAQWQLAALGTPDTYSTDPGDDSEPCNIFISSKPFGSVWATSSQTILSGSAVQCKSRWGAFDMVGNLWEWTALWAVHPGANGESQAMTEEYRGDGYLAGGPRAATMPANGSDGSWRTVSLNFTGNGSSLGNPYGPSAAYRGGYWEAGGGAGVYAVHVGDGPSNLFRTIGARCCRRN